MDSSPERSKSNESIEQEEKREPPAETKRPVDTSKKNCLYVGRFGNNVTDNDLKKVFEQFGELQFAQVIYQPSFSDSPMISRGYGFVKFVNEDHAVKAMAELNIKELFGRECRIEVSKRDRPREDTPGQYLGVKRRKQTRSRHRSSSSRSRGRRHRRHRRRYSSSRSRSYSRGRDRRRRRDSKDRDRDRDRSRDRSRSRSPRRR